MNKLAIFDLDGTLLDTLSDIADNVNLTLKTFGYPERSQDEIKRMVGSGARDLIKNALPCEVSEEELDERLAFYNEKYTNCGSSKTKLFDGVENVLLSLKEDGYKLVIITNKPQATTDEVYKKYLSRFGFDKVVGQSEKVKRKPDPTETLNAVKEFDSTLEKTYFIGDGETDVQTAINAGVRCISALWGNRTKEDLQKAGAKIFALTPEDLLNFIK